MTPDPAASLSSPAASHAPVRRRRKAEDDAKLIEAVKKDGNEDLPAAKSLRRESPTSSSTVADVVVHHAHMADTATTDSPDDTPTDPVSPAASLPSATTSRAPCCSWKPIWFRVEHMVSVVDDGSAN